MNRGGEKKKKKKKKKKKRKKERKKEKNPSEPKKPGNPPKPPPKKKLKKTLEVWRKASTRCLLYINLSYHFVMILKLGEKLTERL